jgi:YHYH protein
MDRAGYRIIALLPCLLAAACGGSASTGDTTSTGSGGSSTSSSASSGGAGGESSSTSSTSSTTATSSGTGMPGGCTLTQDTTATDVAAPSGCHVLTRDTTACEAARKAAGISGFWLQLSCRVSLTTTGGVIKAESDGQPDYKSNYFPKTNVCHEDYAGGIQNPNLIATKDYIIEFPLAPDTSTQTMKGTAVVGVAVNGVPIYGDFAAPGDDIYQEAKTFDACGGHPQMSGYYHYHAEPYAISYDDHNFIGVMRDGYPIYGRKDEDGTYPMLDVYGGHTGTTPDSPGAPVYHYHVNEQTSTNPKSAGEKQWFLTAGAFRGTPAPCGSCN